MDGVLYDVGVVRCWYLCVVRRTFDYLWLDGRWRLGVLPLIAAATPPLRPAPLPYLYLPVFVIPPHAPIILYCGSHPCLLHLTAYITFPNARLHYLLRSYTC